LAVAQLQGFQRDPGLGRIALAHTSGMVTATNNALDTGCTTGSPSSGQHRAKYETDDGFCTFNGITLAAKRALHDGARRILIIDTGAHRVGGTHSLIKNNGRIWQADIAVNSYES
jgi:acetoin utilization deacetylase AcuC-like enzyme